MYYGHMGYFGGLSMIIFWGLFIWLIVWLVTQNKKNDDPRSTLKNRLAKGQISAKEYDQLKKKMED
jgi:uncharacterized membrane protein